MLTGMEQKSRSDEADRGGIICLMREYAETVTRSASAS